MIRNLQPIPIVIFYVFFSNIIKFNYFFLNLLHFVISFILLLVLYTYASIELVDCVVLLLLELSVILVTSLVDALPFLTSKFFL